MGISQLLDFDLTQTLNHEQWRTIYTTSVPGHGISQLLDFDLTQILNHEHSVGPFRPRGRRCRLIPRTSRPPRSPWTPRSWIQWTEPRIRSWLRSWLPWSQPPRTRLRIWTPRSEPPRTSRTPPLQTWSLIRTPWTSRS